MPMTLSIQINFANTNVVQLMTFAKNEKLFLPYSVKCVKLLEVLNFFRTTIIKYYTIRGRERGN